MLFMIRGQISSNISDLNDLHSIYHWIPNENMIRPNSIELSKKHLTLDIIQNEWHSMYDYILFKIFNQNFLVRDNIKYIPYILVDIEEWVFSESIFKYNINSDANHYVLWNSKTNFENGINHFDEKMINSIINNKLTKLKENDNYDFAWYINPKPSIPDFFHVQVFFI